MKRALLPNLLVVMYLLISGCATPYGNESVVGGFSVFPEAADKFRISLRSNAFTSLSQAENIVLLKAAEVTLDAGYERFLVTSNNLTTKPVGQSLFTQNPLMTGLLSVPVRPGGFIRIQLLNPGAKNFERGIDARAIHKRLRTALTTGPRL